MDKLNSRERLIRTFEGKDIDRIPTYDILHNIGLIEYLTSEIHPNVNIHNAIRMYETARNYIL